MAEGTSSHTEADGSGGNFPPFDPSTFPSQLVSLAIAFVALYLIVSRIALPRVGGVIDARQKAIEGDLAQAQKLKDESEAALKAYESELATARSKAQSISAANRTSGWLISMILSSAGSSRSFWRSSRGLLIAFPNVDDTLRESRITQKQNPKTQESEVQLPAFLQNRILHQDQFRLFPSPICILHGRRYI